jgi:hypothetical protein
MSIVIPNKFRVILERDSKLYAATLSSIANISAILEENQLYFFEEYTDHGIKHVQSVLESCQDIIEENTLTSLLSSIDVSLLIHAILLHDIGMHTTLSMLNQLVKGVYDDVRVDYFDDKTWNELWIEYLDESKKFNSLQKKQIFGDEFLIVNVPDIDNKNSITTIDKKLIGEFIRRNHARLAHEISLKGAIVGSKDNISFAHDFEHYQRDLAGLIARSHGINIRDTFDYLKINHSENEWANPYSIKIIYIMILLRIGDYFQFDSGRVSIQTLKIKTFSTPFSELEHLKHLAIKFVKASHSDDETLVVEAAPENSFMFISLTRLFRDIQTEIDISWAVIGEIYGKDIEGKKPKIKYRRIKSNLDDKRGAFVKNLTYIPEEIKFTTDIELLKLLAAPLYGNSPTYGVRELLQNSVDACRERKVEEDKIGNLFVPAVNVELKKDKDVYTFTIEDNGKGMSLFEIKNYFLKAGSSFRKSNDWKKNFTDESGKSIIARNGKFGIGVLAAFLLGAEIAIETKSKYSSQAYAFNASIDSNQIEIKKSTKKELGTTITITIEEDIFNTLSDQYTHDIQWYEWYTLDMPMLNLTKSDNGITSILNKEANFAPNQNTQSTDNWSKINPEGFNGVFWTYAETPDLYKNYKLICNGIIIPEGELPDERDLYLKQTPKVNIFDYEGTLNLNLNRNSLNENPKLSRALLFDVYCDLLAKILCFDFGDNCSQLQNHEIASKGYLLDHECLKSYRGAQKEVIGFSNSGYFVYERNFLKYFPGNNILELVLSEESDAYCKISNEYIVIEVNGDNTIYSLNSDLDVTYYNNLKTGQRVYLKSETYNKMFNSNITGRIRRGLKKKHILDEFQFNNWISYTYNFPHRTNLNFGELIPILPNIKLIKEYKLTDSRLSFSYDETLLAVIEEYLKKDVIIPFDLELRKKKYKHAFRDLKRHIDKYI